MDDYISRQWPQPPEITETVNENGEIVVNGTLSIPQEIVEKCGGEKALEEYIKRKIALRLLKKVEDYFFCGADMGGSP